MVKQTVNCLICCITFLFFLSSGFVSAAQNPADNATKILAAQVAGALPDDIHLRLLAIADIKGDDGSLHRSLTAAIKAKTKFTLIERRDLDKILQEQGMQVSDLADRDTRVKFGQIKGVEAILFGEVLEKKQEFMSASLKAHLQLDNVETGEVVLSRNFETAAQSPDRGSFMAVIVIIGLILLVIFWRKRRTVRVKQEKIQQGAGVRQDIEKEIARALQSIADAQDMLTSSGDTQRAVVLNDAKKDFQLLQQKIANAATGNVLSDTKEQLKGALRIDENILDSVKDITKDAGRLYAKVSNKDVKAIEEDVRNLRAEIKSITAKLALRPVR